MNYSAQLADVKYPYCIGACLNVTGAVDSTQHHHVTYGLLTPALSAAHYASRGLSQAGTALHITEVYTPIDSVV